MLLPQGVSQSCLCALGQSCSVIQVSTWGRGCTPVPSALNTRSSLHGTKVVFFPKKQKVIFLKLDLWFYHLLCIRSRPLGPRRGNHSGCEWQEVVSTTVRGKACKTLWGPGLLLHVKWEICGGFQTNNIITFAFAKPKSTSPLRICLYKHLILTFKARLQFAFPDCTSTVLYTQCRPEPINKSTVYKCLLVSAWSRLAPDGTLWSIKRNELLIHVLSWVNLKYDTLSERSQPQGGSYCMIPIMT